METEFKIWENVYFWDYPYDIKIWYITWILQKKHTVSYNIQTNINEEYEEVRSDWVKKEAKQLIHPYRKEFDLMLEKIK